MTSLFDELRGTIRHGHERVLGTVVTGSRVGSKVLLAVDGTVVASRGDFPLTSECLASGVAVLVAGETRCATLTDGTEVFWESFKPPPRLILIGATDFSAALATVGALVGFHVIVVDARATFATNLRFPTAHEVIVDWPHRMLESISPALCGADALCVLSHDNKFDVPALMSAFDTSVGYIGAMGSRATHAQRCAELAEVGAAPQQIASIYAPIGLDLGGNTPEEMAIAVVAEILLVRSRRTGAPLSAGTGPIHMDPSLH